MGWDYVEKAAECFLPERPKASVREINGERCVEIEHSCDIKESTARAITGHLRRECGSMPIRFVRVIRRRR